MLLCDSLVLVSQPPAGAAMGVPGGAAMRH